MFLNVLSQPFRKRALDLGFFGNDEFARFIILGRSRVGSNLLRGMLNSHPNVSTYGEIFRNTSVLDWDHTGYFSDGRTATLLHDDPVRFLEARLFGRYPRSVRAVGFKLFYYHAHEGTLSDIWPYLQMRSDLKVIHLKRRNLLEVHLSRKRAALTGQWVNTGNGREDDFSIPLDYDECRADFVQTRNWEEEYDRFFADHPVLHVNYEELAGNYHDATEAIAEFLDIDRRSLTPTTVKQARAPLSRSISNYDELKDRFSGTVWEEFFRD